MKYLSNHKPICLVILATCIFGCGTTSEDQQFGGGGSSSVDLSQNPDIGPSQNASAQNFASQDNSPQNSPSGSAPTLGQPSSISGSNPSCATLAFGDGRGGDLWLPVSEGNGLPVYLLNGGWQAPASVEAQLVNGGFERGNFTGFHNPDADGSLRQHFRFSQPCNAYAGRLIVNDSNKSCEVIIPGVCSRID